MSFAQRKNDFDIQNRTTIIYQCFLSQHLNYNTTTSFKKKNGELNEEYYKWQFLYALVYSGLVQKDYIGTELSFPKGNKNSAPLKIDGAIFDDISWFNKYRDYHTNGNLESLEWLRNHLIAVIEFKKEDNKNISEVWDKQLKAYLKESQRKFCLGILYDTERLYLFRKYDNKFTRYSEDYNVKGQDSKTKELSLHLPDPYFNIPNFNQLLEYACAKSIDKSSRSIKDLYIISGVNSIQINDSMSSILQTLDKVGMVNQRGFEILIQILSLKIYDEKNNERYPNSHLKFYITDSEKKYSNLSDDSIQQFINRFGLLKDDASGEYYRILNDNVLDTKNENHIKILIEVVSQFQDYSFVNSHKTDLYQLVFHKFAAPFSKEQNAQFVTPLPIIDFLVNIVNPRNGETVIDPTVGIADFLSVSYVNSNSKLDDSNIFGMDIDAQMVMLATLNMLLNGDGNSKIEAKSGYGSLLSKFDAQGNIIELIPSMNESGNWDKRADNKILKKFDVVLTNPPFGENRSFKIKTDKDLEVINCYELWGLYNNSGGKKNKNQTGKIDLGVIFLENAYRILKENGRIGIVLSNSIASIDTHKIARQWLMKNMRIVAIFDLPDNVFAETGVNTTIIVAYKPSKAELLKLQNQNYQIFCKDVQKIGYEVKTSKRVKTFSPLYKINYNNFEIEIDNDGNPLLDEDFTQIVSDFKQWCLGQEKQLQDIFIKVK
ncbi:restriction endonuclease subunit M [Commensalibacter intestini]|uniref:Restriction endonuclease subunit M n=1 Tax=Commensalibacter intestini TaxID=479936 RepID=A0A251ZTQ1_9PROT|nr:N-6 DNA methylase [Commensalibacter intestini]OUI78043.1 restriction endonuclease subunit M [Commensalibacter intestini]